MATINGLTTKYDVSNRLREHVDNAITMLARNETPMLSFFRRVPVGNSTFAWIYEELRGFTTAVTTSLASSAAGTTDTLGITAGEGTSKFHTTSATRPGVIRINEEYMKVIGNAANTLTVIRGFSGTTPAVHAVAAVVYYVGESEVEGSDADNALIEAPTQPNNETQIFSEVIQVSGTAEEISRRGYQYGTSSNIQHDIEIQMLNLAKRAERMLVLGAADSSSSSTSVARFSKGLFDFIPSSNYADASGASLSKTFLHSDLKTLWDLGSRPSIFMANSTQILKIQELWEDRIRTEVLENVGGFQVSQIANPFGGYLALFPNPAVPMHEYYLLDPNYVEVAELRPFRSSLLGKTGDKTEIQVVGELACKVTAPKAHFRRYNLSTTIS